MMMKETNESKSFGKMRFFALCMNFMLTIFLFQFQYHIVGCCLCVDEAEVYKYKCDAVYFLAYIILKVSH